MVSMKEVRLSNDGLKNGPAGLIALFVGATAGMQACIIPNCWHYWSGVNLDLGR
jgi:hypothetical protein